MRYPILPPELPELPEMPRRLANSDVRSHTMTAYTAEVLWSRSGQTFVDNRYSRKHILRFDGGIEVSGSSSPHVVPPPYSVPNAIDPEEMFVSSLSSCHMLWFLSIAAKRGFVVDRYHDIAEGVMEQDSKGKLMMSVVTLRPEVPEMLPQADSTRPGCTAGTAVPPAPRASRP